MSFPLRTLAKSSKSVDFPTPVSPRRRMVYGAFALLAGMLMIPSLRDSMSLEIGLGLVHPRIFGNQLDSQNVIFTIFIMGILSNFIVCLGHLHFAGGNFVTGRTTQASGDPRLGISWKDGRPRHDLKSVWHCFGDASRGTIRQSEG